MAAGVATLALFLTTLDEPTITWDEGPTIRREEQVCEWFRLLISPPPGATRGQLFDEPVLSRAWPFAREEPDGHPPFYAVLGVLGWQLSHRWLPPLEAHRFGPVLLFCLTTAVMYHFLARRWGRLAGAAAAGAWVLMPRVFAHAHLASYDIPLACLWFLAVVAFWKARESWPDSRRAGLAWSVVFAVVLALAAATKFTGWLIPLPLLTWSAACGLGTLRREGFSVLKRLVPVVAFAMPWLVMVPEVLRLFHETARIEATLEGSPDFLDSQRRAAHAAGIIRSKESGWLPLAGVFVPAALWFVSLLLRTRRGFALAWFSGGPIAEIWTAAAALTPALTIILCPPWWPDPLRGLAIFLWSNLTRQKTTWIPTQFFGTIHEFSLPWYNTLAWVGLTVPPLVLLLILLGVACTLARQGRIEDRRLRMEDRGRSASEANPAADRHPQSSILDPQSLAWLLLINAATLLVIRALPGTPGHDGERQLLGSFPFLASLAGVGAYWLRRLLEARLPASKASWIARGIVGVSLGWAAIDVWYYRPVQLSYYTELVGGLRGAERLGLEPTYYWDALDENVLDWLNQNTRPGEKVLFCNYAEDSFRYLGQWGKLKANIWPYKPGLWRWYVLQNRPGLFAEKPWDRWLAENGRPAFTREQSGVPLLWIFSIEEYEKAIRQTERNPEGG